MIDGIKFGVWLFFCVVFVTGFIRQVQYIEKENPPLNDPEWFKLFGFLAVALIFICGGIGYMACIQ